MGGVTILVQDAMTTRQKLKKQAINIDRTKEGRIKG